MSTHKTNGARIFISYAHKDKIFRDEIIKGLIPFQEQGILSYWSDLDIKPGDEWDTEIQKELNQCHIILLLISRDFLASQYINSIELEQAIERHKKGEARILSIIVRECNWMRIQKISQHQVILTQKKPIDSHPRKDEAYANVVDKIIDAVESFGTTIKTKIANEAKNSTITPDNIDIYYLDTDELHLLKGKDYVERIDVTQNNSVDLFFEQKVMVDTIHSGGFIPERFASYFDNTQMKIHFREEKDWGANAVAFTLAQHLGLKCFHRVNIARALLDFGRFPGITTSDTIEHMHRLAIYPPISDLLSYEEKYSVLDIYDSISLHFDQEISQKKLKIAIHTYDRYNPAPLKSDRTERPIVSLLYRSLAYQTRARMPFGLFDKLYVEELGEFTADRKLISRISLDVGKANISLAHNHPYALPEGSVEVRSSVWMFFRFLRKYYLAENSNMESDEHLNNVWEMLLDTNLRNGDSEILRSYIHSLRTPPQGYKGKCVGTQKAYEQLKKYIKDKKEILLDEYQKTNNLFNSLAIEIRKDYVWDFQKMKPIEENVNYIAKLIAKSIKTYYQEDLKSVQS